MNDIRIWRDDTGTVHASVPQTIFHHSPAGYEFGYEGSGPADLALNILNAFVPPGRAIDWESEPLIADDFDRDDAPEKCWQGTASRFAWLHHQDFKREFIATISRLSRATTIKATDIEQWITARRRQRNLSL